MMLMMSKGDLFPFDGPIQEGMTVSLSDYGLNLAIFSKPDHPMVGEVLHGKVQVGFLKAPPFGWWFINTGRSFVDACWTMARVPMECQPLVQGVLEYVLETLDPKAATAQIVPPSAITVVNVLDQRIMGFRAVGLKADSWIRTARSLLDLPAEIPEDKLRYWQHKYESRWYGATDFGTAKELLWVDTFE